jgi:hypothetical protein
MARDIKQSSDRTFGGQAIPAGTYFIADAIITNEKLEISGQPTVEYDLLQIVLKEDNNGVAGAEMEQTLHLNGCHRPRRGSDGGRYQASGSLYDGLIKACQGKSFTQTRDWLKANYANKRISLTYTEYPSQHGGFGRVPKVEFL